MAYKRVEFRTRSGKTVSFRTRGKTRARVGKKERRPKVPSKRKSRSKDSLNAWGYGRVR